MSTNYTAPLPRDASNEIMQEFPAPILPQARFASDNASASSVISFTHNTVALEVFASTVPALFRWVATTDTQASVTTANYGHVIPAGEVRRLVVPRERQATGYTSIQGANRAEGLYQRAAYMSAGVGSVYTVEFGQG